MGLGIMLAVAALMLAGSGAKKAAAKATPRGAVTLGPVKILKTPAKKPVKNAAAAKPSAASAAPPVHVVVPQDLPRETVAIAALAAKQSGANPLQPNAAAARAGAQSAADAVRSKGSKYDRARLAAWQVFAGLKPDGLYGPATVTALRQNGALNVMGAVFKAAAR